MKIYKSNNNESLELEALTLVFVEHADDPGLAEVQAVAGEHINKNNLRIHKKKCSMVLPIVVHVFSLSIFLF